MKVQIGDEVAFNKLPDATWFKVVDIHNEFTLAIYEVDTNYAAQFIDVSAVKQVRKSA